MATSARSRNASAYRKNRRERLDRPFAPGVLKRAKEIVARYQVIVGLEEDGEYFGRGLELPFAMGSGKTPTACVESTRGSMVALVAYMIESGEKPPIPASAQTRLVQLNVRVSAEEKLIFEEAARQKRQGLSDFIRDAALQRIVGKHRA